MFNWSWELREQNEFISPVGPSFEWAPTKCLKLNGSQIWIKVPRHRTTAPVENITLDHKIDLDRHQGDYQQHNGIKDRYTTLLKREWDFYGPWFTGQLGTITMTATLHNPVDAPEGLNYFHPRALEAGIADHLTASFADTWDAELQRFRWQAPMNWRPLPDFPCAAARFDAVDTVVNSNGPDSYLVLPVSKSYLLVFKCTLVRSRVFTDKKPKPTVDEWIDHQPFLTLADQVLSSIRVELSERALAEQAEALRGLEDTALVKEYPPLQWTPPPQEPIDNSWIDGSNL